VGEPRYTPFVSDPAKELVQTEQALYNFLQAHGTSGVISTSIALQPVCWSDLDQAILVVRDYAQYAVHT
jgi:hypothetical protein